MFRQTKFFLSVPEITCPIPLSEDGIITVSWSYVHTGGLPLTALSVMYSYVDRQTTFTNPVPINDVGSLSATVSGLVVGFMYTFSVTAENSNGSSTTICVSVLHEIGKINRVYIYGLLCTRSKM